MAQSLISTSPSPITRQHDREDQLHRTADDSPGVCRSSGPDFSYLKGARGSFVVVLTAVFVSSFRSVSVVNSSRSYIPILYFTVAWQWLLTECSIELEHTFSVPIHFSWLSCSENLRGI
ncbi:hypothetical protein Pyn_14768 [Prunus yedoensis var. nudiflora]|uniref:Uncharacterized protein n=1 Tax=Prunus yedoensis var. nudiflora TaxID=2094558 RepID=A0A314Z6F3_PRUYE|nr:hypothetical protein Pyn_14768 [Prunus yedoensis var. nudiflora]